ncbi:hypothetical protein BGZ76_008341, partial [Entomortierella beljakovae]
LTTEVQSQTSQDDINLTAGAPSSIMPRELTRISQNEDSESDDEPLEDPRKRRKAEALALAQQQNQQIAEVELATTK